MRFGRWLQNILSTEMDYVVELEIAERERKSIIFRVQHDLVTVAVSLGQNEAQIEAKVDALFSTFAAEWAIYALTGSPAIITSITDDVTLPWLDTDVAGTTIRQRLINRLTED